MNELYRIIIYEDNGGGGTKGYRSRDAYHKFGDRVECHHHK